MLGVLRGAFLGWHVRAAAVRKFLASVVAADREVTVHRVLVDCADLCALFEAKLLERHLTVV